MSVLLRLSAGLIVWAMAFCLTYGLHGIGCASGWPARTVAGLGLHRAVLVVAWMGTIAASVAVAVTLSRRRDHVLDRVAMVTGWIGVAATVVTFVPILAIRPCL